MLSFGLEMKVASLPGKDGSGPTGPGELDSAAEPTFPFRLRDRFAGDDFGVEAAEQILYQRRGLGGAVAVACSGGGGIQRLSPNQRSQRLAQGT